MPNYRFALIAISALALTSCSYLNITSLECTPGVKPMISEMLYFGGAKPTGKVTTKDWSDFLHSTVTPHFPDGLTYWQASGQWQGSDEALTHEDTYVLSVVHEDNKSNEDAINHITSEYKKQFQQEAVLRVKNEVCTSP